jgi:hypothetical protein
MYHCKSDLNLLSVPLGKASDYDCIKFAFTHCKDLVGMHGRFWSENLKGGTNQNVQTYMGK